MIITYLRSSSFNTHRMCPQQYFIGYVLGWPLPPINNKADKGTIVHKVLEVLAEAKLAHQKGQRIAEDEELGQFDVSNIMADKFVQQIFQNVYQYYSTRSIFKFWPKDRQDCLNWVYKVLDEGMYDPRNMKVVAPEGAFDITINKPWAQYDYTLPDGTQLYGQLSIKGTIDLVVEAKENIYELIDWKTGSRLDWATGKEKDFEYLCTDPQLLIYHYALRELYPNVEQFFITIHYINSGGPFTMAYGPQDIELAETKLKEKFEEIKQTVQPKLHRSWKCKKLCFFGKNKHPKDETKTICAYIDEQIRKYGIEHVMRNELQPGHTFDEYERG